MDYRLPAPTPPRRVGAVLEASDFHPGRSGREHLRFARAAAGYLVRGGVDEVLRLVELDGAAGRRVKGLLARHAAAARAGIGAARRTSSCSLLDEPANGLDPEGNALAARLPPFPSPGSGGRRPRVQPRALRGRAQGRPRRDHQPRPASSQRAALVGADCTRQPRAVRVRSPQADSARRGCWAAEGDRGDGRAAAGFCSVRGGHLPRASVRSPQRTASFWHELVVRGELARGGLPRAHPRPRARPLPRRCRDRPDPLRGAQAPHDADDARSRARAARAGPLLRRSCS